MILDFTYRLPGPLACYQLSELGFDIHKIELKRKEDPFKIASISGCNVWYRNLNVNHKQILITGKKEIEKYVRDNLQRIEGIIIDQNNSIKDSILESIEHLSFPFITICSSKEKRPLHDLDLLVKESYFLDNDTQLPQFPFLGILFSKAISSTFLLEAYKGIKNKDHQFKEEKIYFDEEINKILTPINLPRAQRFYTGKLASYKKYFLKNGLLFLTAIEQRSFDYFLEFIDLKHLKNSSSLITSESEIGKIIAKKLSLLNMEHFDSYPKNKVCFSLKCF